MRGADEQAITFTDEDGGRVHHSHDNAIIITLLIANYTTRRVLVDNGSLADILYYLAFQQMRLEQNQFRPVCSPLVGFGGMTVQLVSTIILLVVVGAYPQKITKDFKQDQPIMQRKELKLSRIILQLLKQRLHSWIRMIACLKLINPREIREGDQTQ